VEVQRPRRRAGWLRERSCKPGLDRFLGGDHVQHRPSAIDERSADDARQVDFRAVTVVITRRAIERNDHGGPDRLEAYDGPRHDGLA
jgi:hypothetical protein